MRRLIALLLLIGAMCLSTLAVAQPRAPLVLAAASLQESLSAVADAWATQRKVRPILSFAASSALARQVEAGAPADLFISADEPWMDALQSKGLIDVRTRRSFLTNRLVLVAPAGKAKAVTLRRGFPLARMLGAGRLAMADPDAVPAGKYGKAALTELGVWQSIESKVARAENVRAALALVERGQAPYGIVYETDARASKAVRIVGLFPANSHPPITYPVAILKASSAPDARAFLAFLTSARAKTIFRRYGFGTP